MEIRVACPFCAKPQAVDLALAGRRRRCNDCGTVTRSPQPPAAAPRPRLRPAPASPPEPAVDEPYGLMDEPEPAPRGPPARK
ncbi:hypothetical protein [Paludisphaera mucosa]|uniref:Thioredoxin n=1 Tax=Paludisphaera mucosa TaxID=3030827 RepID=A0ABT6FHS0_9BACT|nr:hypothetical protein [Paludisphaera mucosa]MDG3007141.1 hypothetical protein [Paludisphaera mucosa]